MKRIDAKGTNAAGERSDVAPSPVAGVALGTVAAVLVPEHLKLIGRETTCRKCASTVSVVALPGTHGVRVGWHRVVDAKVKGIQRPVYVTCAGSWAEVAP